MARWAQTSQIAGDGLLQGEWREGIQIEGYKRRGVLWALRHCGLHVSRGQTQEVEAGRWRRGGRPLPVGLPTQQEEVRLQSLPW